MKIKKIVLILLVMQSIVKLSKAQQDPLYGQYVFNNAIINPAQAGVKENNQLGLLYRNQWAGIDGAPINKSLFLNMRLPKNLGLALGIYSDEIGPIRELTIQSD
jgi:type IX secretion system PorP/SprF family membrane protein